MITIVQKVSSKEQANRASGQRQSFLLSLSFYLHSKTSIVINIVAVSKEFHIYFFSTRAHFSHEYFVFNDAASFDDDEDDNKCDDDDSLF